MTQSSLLPATPPLNHDLNWLSGGGEMGALIRTMDWSKTSLGPLESWPQSLRTSVSLCLSSTFPILVAWGPQDVQIYNDAYRPICGAKHPESMGEPFKVCWATALPVVGDAFDRAHEGEGAYIRDQRMFLDRYGYLEEAFMTFSFSSIRDESGKVGGVFHPITESTGQVLNARRTQGLRDLSAAIGTARAIPEVGAQMASQYDSLALDVPFLLFYQIDADSGQVLLRASAGLPVDSALAPSSAALDDAVWPFAATARAGVMQQVDGLEARFGLAACGPYQELPRSAMVLPLALPGQAALFGFLVAGASACRALDDDYFNFYALLGGAVNTAVGNVLAYEREQRRAEELAEIDRSKTAFFSNVSHEFRTPLTLILGPLAESLADTRHQLDPVQRQRIEVTHRNSLRLLKLVNSLLDFSRIEAGRVMATYVASDLRQVTLELAGVFESAMEKGGLAYTVHLQDLGEPVYIDRDMWEKIVFNLLSNAFKFTLQGEVAVTLRRHDGMARLSVCDTGSGIPAHELPRMFERFHRIEGAPGRTYEGTGIGLALIQELVRLHGGTIAVHSVEGEGTRFDVDLPFGSEHLPAERLARHFDDANTQQGASFVEEALRWLPDAADPAPAAAAASAASPVVATARARPRIVVADDNNDMRAYIKSLLGAYADVTACADGEAAFELLLADPPDLLVSDVMMPKLDGFGLIARLRATESLRHLPVMLLSARAGEEAKVEGLRAGADDYLVKPFAASELQARVERQLGLARERRQQSREALKQEAYFRTLIDASPVMLWTTDVSGSCTYLSQRWSDFTGRRQAQDLGFGWLENLHADDMARTREQFLAANASHAPFSFDYRLRRQDGQYRWAIDIGMPRFDDSGQPAGYVGTVIDVHELKLLQERAEALAGELGLKNRMQSEFLVTLAHELRNPLAPIRTGLELMRAGAPAGTHHDIRGMMERQVNHMVHLVDDLLDMARLTSGKLNLKREAVTLDVVVTQAIEISMPLVTAGGHQLDVKLPPGGVALHVDRHRIAQVLSNLVNNAAKYTPQGGAITVAARIDAVAKQVVIDVRDNGVGIAADVLATVFDLYAQAPGSEGMSQGGLGVGLSLAQRLVQLHGGQVEAASAGIGHGSRFTVRLPLFDGDQLPEAVAQTAAPAASAPASATAMQVLLVDDNVDAAETLSALLEFSGYEVMVAHDGASALELAAQSPVPLVLLDIGLPDMDGYAVAVAMRKMDGMQQATLIALTGWGSEQDRLRSQQAGFDLHLTKPVDFAALQTTLAQVAARQP
ncbi:ATP-binding protein [Janthinobacterium psychrotolerans]|uniref:ATP-binding protein n=1 Tax=Janthinobacterium psychrotolerans TaxID=1747903 RepID=UPI0008067336|nr:ATP-binding protein [Janthinobacterium psychrotolerans]